jgi:ribosome recycling factor
MVQPFDASTLQDVERGIREANIGINPSTEGKSIRLPVPELTEERRRAMVKILKGNAEEARVRIRGARRDGMEQIKKLEKDKVITEDDRRENEEAIQKLTDKHVHEIDELAKRKEVEVMTV